MYHCLSRPKAPETVQPLLKMILSVILSKVPPTPSHSSLQNGPLKSQSFIKATQFITALHAVLNFLLDGVHNYFFSILKFFEKERKPTLFKYLIHKLV